MQRLFRYRRINTQHSTHNRARQHESELLTKYGTMVIDFHYGHGLVKLMLAWNFLRRDLRSEVGRLSTFFNLVHQEKLI